MNAQRWSALAIIAIGVAALFVPVFTPPRAFYPSPWAFIPYALLFVAVFLARSRGESWFVISVSVIIAFVGGYLYLDAFCFNKLFAWDSVGLVYYFGPGFAVAPALACFIILGTRRLRGPHEHTEAA